MRRRLQLYVLQTAPLRFGDKEYRPQQMQNHHHAEDPESGPWLHGPHTHREPQPHDGGKKPVSKASQSLPLRTAENENSAVGWLEINELEQKVSEPPMLPIYRKLLAHRRRKYADEILARSEAIINR